MRTLALATAPLVLLGAVTVAQAADKPCSAMRDVNADGQPDFRVSYVYDGEQLVTEATYPAGAARPISVTANVYDPAGRLWGKSIDSNGDGTPDRNVYYVYRKDGQLHAEGIDDGPDAWLNQVIVYSYDGTVRYAAVDIGADGSVDRVDRLTSTYDRDGRLIRQVLDRRNDGSVEQVSTFVYDAGGNLSSELVDLRGDRTIDEIVSYQYQC